MQWELCGSCQFFLHGGEKLLYREGQCDHDCMGSIKWGYSGTNLAEVFRLDKGLFDNMPLITEIE